MKLGEHFEYKGVMLKVARDQKRGEFCEGCYFHGKYICPKDEHNSLLCNNKILGSIIFKEVKMTHKIFKVINFYYIHLDDKRQLCPLADYISENNPEIEVLEVRYNPQAEQGVVIVKTDDYQAYSRLNNVVDEFKNDINCLI